MFINQARNLTARSHTRNRTRMWLILHCNPITTLLHNFLTEEVLHNTFFTSSLPYQMMFLTPTSIPAKILDDLRPQQRSTRSHHDSSLRPVWDHAAPPEQPQGNKCNKLGKLHHNSGIWQKVMNNELYAAVLQGSSEEMHFPLFFKLGNKWDFKIIVWHGGGQGKYTCITLHDKKRAVTLKSFTLSC